MNIQQFSISALADIMMDDDTPVVEASADDNKSETYDESGAYEEDFEHESQGVSMSKDQGYDISLIPQSSEGDGSMHEIDETGNPDDNDHDQYLSGEEENIIGEFRKNPGGHTQITVENIDDVDDALEVFRQRQQPEPFPVFRTQAKGQETTDKKENTAKPSQVRFTDDTCRKAVEQKPSPEVASQPRPQISSTSSSSIYRANRGKVKTPYSRVGVMPSHKIPAPQRQGLSSSPQSAVGSTKSSPGQSSPTARVHGLNDADLHVLRTARAVLDRLEAKQGEDAVAAMLPRRAVRIPNISLGLSSRDDDMLLYTSAGRICPIPDLDDLVCPSDESRQVHDGDNEFSEDSNGHTSAMSGVNRPEEQQGMKRNVPRSNEVLEPPPPTPYESKSRTLCSLPVSTEREIDANGSCRRVEGLHIFTNDKLRLGTQHSQLCNLADETYTKFLNDMIATSRTRATAASSVEELAMHRVLAEFVNRTFSEPDFVRSLRASMVAAATDVSLSCPP